MAESRELSTRECELLLRAGFAGRIAVSTPAGPHLVPVNYTVVDDAIIVRTSPYSLLGTYGREAMLAFGIDGLDRYHRRGWSVQARGRVHAVIDRAEVERIREVAEPQPLADGARTLYLRLRWTELTGRKLGADFNPTRDLPVAADA